MYRDKEKQRAAWRRYYQKNPKAFYERRKEKKRIIKELVDSLKSVPCMDCKRSFPPCAMDFDHVRGDKLLNIALIAGGYGGRPMLMEEIKKCEIVCSNCHRIRTHERRKKTK